jgi:hypothetical protein
VIDVDDDFKILSDIYDEIAIEMSERVPGYVAVGVTIVDFRKRLWKKYHINRRKFADMLQRVRDYDYNNSNYNRIKLYGGPIYLKDDWVECDGRHWLLIEIETEDHKRRMAPHREHP